MAAYTNAALFEEAVASGDPDVIGLDLNMPETDGIALMRWLATRGSRARIFIMSGIDPIQQIMAEKMGESLGLFMAGIIPKPVRIAELRAMLTPTEPADR